VAMWLFPNYFGISCYFGLFALVLKNDYVQ